VCAAAVCGVLFIWPSFSLRAANDLLDIARGRVAIGAAVRNLYRPEQAIEAGLVPTWVISESTHTESVPVFAFPYDNQIPAAIRRPFLAPVLESYMASTESLGRYYVRGLERQRQEGIDVVYGPDRGTGNGDTVQAITRAPEVFEYIYEHFELTSSEDHLDGHYMLRARRERRGTVRAELGFLSTHTLPDRGLLKLTAPSTCGLIRVQLWADYAKNPIIFRPSGIELTLSSSNHPVWQGTIRPPEANQSFVTYISPLAATTFHQVFGEDPIQGLKWDTVEYRPLAADVLGSQAERIHVQTLECLDARRFTDAAAAQTPDLQ